MSKDRFNSIVDALAAKESAARGDGFPGTLRSRLSDMGRRAERRCYRYEDNGQKGSAAMAFRHARLCRYAVSGLLQGLLG